MINRVHYFGTAFTIMAAIAGASHVHADDKSSDSSPHYRAKQILGSKVSIDGNMQVGTVDDIVLDENGNVDYLIVVTDNNKLVTVPWDATRFNAEKRSAFVKITHDRFKQIPTYSTDDYPGFSTPQYRTQTYRYYGLTPAQERRMIRQRGAVIRD